MLSLRQGLPPDFAAPFVASFSNEIRGEFCQVQNLCYMIDKFEEESQKKTRTLQGQKLLLSSCILTANFTGLLAHPVLGLTKTSHLKEEAQSILVFK